MNRQEAPAVLANEHKALVTDGRDQSQRRREIRQLTVGRLSRIRRLIAQRRTCREFATTPMPRNKFG